MSIRKILYISPHCSLNGPSILVHQLIDKASAKKIDIIFITDKVNQKYADTLNCQVYYLKYLNPHPLRFFYMHQNIVKLKEILKKYMPHVIHCFSAYTTLLAVLATSGTTCNNIVTTVNGIKKEYLYFLFQNKIKLIAVSTYIKERLKKFYKKNIEVIYPPIRVFNIPSPLTYNQKILQIGTCGSLIKSKNFDLILRSVKILNLHSNVQLKLLIAGVGKEFNTLRALAKNLNIEENVTFLGPVIDMKSFYKNIHIYISVSFESFGISIGEAMAAGIPALFLRQANILEIFKNLSIIAPFLITKISDAGIAEKVLLIAKNDFSSYTQKIKNFILKNFTIDTIFNKYKEVYNSLEK